MANTSTSGFGAFHGAQAFISSSTALACRLPARVNGPLRTMETVARADGRHSLVGVDHTGVIVAHALTDATVDDETTGVELIEAVNDDIANVTADAAYDTGGCYDAAGARGATVVVPPTKTARVSRRRPRPSARDHTITTVKSLGRRRWKKTSRDHQHARVENAFFRDTSIIGDGLRARTLGGRTVEAPLACTMLNAMPDMSRPASYAVGRCSTGGWDRGVPVSIRAPTPHHGLS